jgi:methyltransferase (TIGR00027 family)
MENAQSLNFLGSTAYWTASVRAMESTRPDRSFNDPWALALAGAVGQSWIENRTPESVIPIVLRTRFFDDFLQRITNQYNVRQVVLVAAGLDTRAFRLTWPDPTRLFELDQPDVIRYKDKILHSSGALPACQRHTIEADLKKPWIEEMKGSGYNPQSPSVWLLEGFLFYLANEQIARILDQVTELAAPESWLGCDVVNSATLTSQWTRQWIEMQAQLGAPWIGTMDDPEEFFRGRGWSASVTQAGAEDANFGRWPYPVLPVKMPDIPHNWFVTAEKIPNHDRIEDQ